MKSRSPIVWIILIVEICVFGWTLFGYAAYLILSASHQLGVANQNAAAPLSSGELLAPVIIGMGYLAGAISLFQYRKVAILCFVLSLIASVFLTIAWSFQRAAPIEFQPIWIIHIFAISYTFTLWRKGVLS